MLNVCHAYLFFSIKFAGGTSDLMFKICKAQKKAGLNPTVYSGDYRFDHELAARLKGVNFKVVKSYLDKLGFSIMPSLFSLLKVDIKNYDVVHMHVYRTFQNVVLYHYCKKHNIPFIMDAHGSVPYYKKKNRIKKWFDALWGKKMLHDAAFLVAETQVGVDEYKALDPTLSDDKIVIISPPFDTDEFLSLPERGLFRAKYNIPENEKVIMFLGRIHHIKGNDFLIKGFAELAKTRQDVRCVLVGPDDGHMDECKALAKELGVADRVMFVGYLGNEHKNSALVDADIVVQLSRQEQGAWAPFEGVLCETPIVVTGHTGTGEDVRRIDAGACVDFDDAPGLAAQFEEIFEHYTEAKAKTLKAKQHIIDKLSMNSRVGEYTELYEKAMQQAAHAGKARDIECAS